MNNKTDEKGVQKDYLTIPIYLNTKIVLDMLATIEDGFAVVKNIQTSKNKTQENGTEADIGSSNIFAFLNIGLKGKHSAVTTGSETSSEERTHTTVSLFQQLKLKLEEAKLIVRDSDSFQIGDFIEMQGIFKANPLIDMLSGLNEMMSLYSLFFEKNNQYGNKKNGKILSDTKVSSQIKGLICSLHADGQSDIICKSNNISVILPTYDSYFINNNMSEITDGKYKFLGKIVQMFIDDGEISLLRNTAFSKLNVEKIKELENIFNDDSFNQYMNGKISTSVKAPVIMVIPIAIYI